MWLIVWKILNEAAVFILAGFLIAALIEGFVSIGRIVRPLSEIRAKSVLLATLMGVPLPLCSCSVLPTALTLRRKGASKGSTLSFLISTPETSITSVLLTYALLGPMLAVFRPIAACLTAITAGLSEHFFEYRCRALPEETSESGDDCCTVIREQTSHLSGDAQLEISGWFRFRSAMRFAFVDLFDDIFGWLLLGIIVAAAIQVWLPPQVLNQILGGPIQSMLLMLLIGVPLYVCAEASTPIAAVLIAQGMNPGAALVFLLVGPATNIGSLGLLVRQLGMRSVVIYLSTIVIVSLGMGVFLNLLIDTVGFSLGTRVMEEPLVPQWLKVSGALLFIFLGIMSIRRKAYGQSLANWLNRRMPFSVSRRVLDLGAVILVLFLYFGSGFYIVGPGDVGLVRCFGAVQSPTGPGLHYALPPPMNQVDRVAVHRIRRLLIEPIQNGSDSPQSWHLLGDENFADIQFVVHWSASADRLIDFAYGTVDQPRLIRTVVLGAVRQNLAGVPINKALTSDRQATELKIEELAQGKLDIYGSGIRLLAVRAIYSHAPPQVHDAFRDVASALEDQVTVINQARATQAQLIPEANGEAAFNKALAQNYVANTVHSAKGKANRFTSLLEVYEQAPYVTRRRLELEAMENVLPGLRKYIKPVGADVGELEIWFVGPGSEEQVRPWPPTQ